MEFLIAAFAIPLVFWIFFLIEIVWLFSAVHKESGRATSGCLFMLVIFGVIKAGSVAAAINFVVSNLLFLGIAFVAMLTYGIFWSMQVKWRLYISDKIKLIEEEISSKGRDKASAIFSHGSYGMTSSTCNEILESNFACLAPKFKDNKARIVYWVIYCIPSTIWFLINDPIRRAANYLVEKLKNYYQSISTGAFDSKFKK